MATHVAASESLLKNAGFENGSTSWSATGTASCIVRKDWHAQSSRWSFGIGNDDGEPNAYGRVWQDIDLHVPLALAKACVFSFYMLAEDSYSGSLVMTLEFRDADGNVIDGEKRSFAPRKGEWKKNRLKVMAPRATQTIRAMCSSELMPVGEGLSCVWLDNGSLTLK